MQYILSVTYNVEPAPNTANKKIIFVLYLKQ